ncbi:deoxyribose-phosphate aldolase/phospho-2-dehydro-3-deoxyheptonate aldolase [Fibrella aestuarina BUZ 2]|uniref:Deoxyribose-phosphate aldolase/phospho-2-dehydro-3-deoxyheptonate aldolase n=1 Tax=Fibrella aestuarina BUZ 2 TaxID=1166018 RepID=I0K3I5_9BACT|nr:deoxyribose-phosphate aldolase/phospho-2-dehydro-3-deoxyheptonate aldolase [Fibrella aestuarina]CCG98688.1 deoxyribose-phosphate aldolase/phospho-2-dehydro-3-deoxyheptonate aldolase [Fibrella aestuarina BUZ 2]
MNHLFPYIERTLLYPNVTINEQYDALDEVNQLGLLGLVVAPFWVKKHRRELGDSHPATLTAAIGYPFGYQRTEVKQQELELALADGANSIDVVLNTSALLSPTSVWLKIELVKLAAAAHAQEVPLTVVLEQALLTDEQLLSMIKTAADAGVDGLKNSTGMPLPGLVPPSFSLDKALAFRAAVPRSLGVCIVADGASEAELDALVAAGVDRLALSRLP